MTTENDVTQMETNAETLAPEKPKIPKIAWLIGGGCLLVICCAAVIALSIAGYIYFAGGSSVAEVVPASAMMYAEVDFLQTQSDQFNKIVPIFQGIADVEKQPLVDAMEEAMQDDLDMSFKSEVMPWMGQHGAFVVTGGNIQSGEFEYMLIIEARDKKLADAFVPKLVAAIQDSNNMEFEQKDVDGVTFHIYKSGYGRYEDVVIARSGSFVYLANSEDAVVSSINTKSANSLAKSKDYQKAMSALPKSRFASFYVSGDAISTFASDLSREMSGLPANQLADDSISGVGISASLEDAGLRFDAAVAYDENKINDFQKETLKAKYLAPKADGLVSEDTLFFFGANSSLSPARFVQSDNPLYTQDMKESFDLFESQYDVSIEDLFKILTGEFALAIGPSKDGLIAKEGDIDIGVTLFAATNDDAGFNAWIQSALDALSKEEDVQFTSTDIMVGDYKLQQLGVKVLDIGSLALYGADNGYVIIGTSQDILEKGLSGNGTLADNARYKDAWKAFPSSSVPYTYVNLTGILDMYQDMPGGDLGPAEADLRKIPTIAMTMNQSSNYVGSMTMIVFINTK